MGVMTASEPQPDASVPVQNPYSAPTSEAGAPVGGIGEVQNLGKWSASEGWRSYWPLALASGTSFGLFFSLWLATMGKPAIPILVAIGLGEGIFFGAFFGTFLSIMMRPATFAVAVEEQEALLDRLDQQIQRLRYRPGSQTDVLRVYTPRTLFRPRAAEIRVQVAPALVTVVGPRANLKVLRRRLEQG
jgi:hypothetical protein